MASASCFGKVRCRAGRSRQKRIVALPSLISANQALVVAGLVRMPGMALQGGNARFKKKTGGGGGGGPLIEIRRIGAR